MIAPNSFAKIDCTAFIMPAQLAMLYEQLQHLFVDAKAHHLYHQVFGSRPSFHLLQVWFFLEIANRYHYDQVVYEYCYPMKITETKQQKNPTANK